MQLLFPLMQENMERLQKEVSWFVEKNDYRNKDKDWGTSADSIQRGMQKCAGGFPADETFQSETVNRSLTYRGAADFMVLS